MHATSASEPHGRELEVFAPTPDLAPYVRRVLVVDAELTAVTRYPAAHRSFLLIHLGGHPVVGGARRAAAPGSALLTGPSTVPFDAVRMGPRFQFLAVEFTGIGVHALFGDVLPDLVDRLEPLGTIASPTRVRSLEHELVELPTHAARVTRLMSFLRERIPSRLPSLARHSRRFFSLLEGSAPSRIGDLSTELGISSSMLRRATTQVCGVSPKAIVASERLNGALRALVDGRRPSLTHLAHSLDFHDQPHFTRAFRRYAGFPPSKLPREEFQLARWML